MLRQILAAACLSMVLTTPTFAASAADSQPQNRVAIVAPPLDAKALATRWGVLAELAGTTWTEGADQVIDYRWEVPGELMFITTRGLWGSWQTAVFPSTDGKRLLARTKIVDTGNINEGNFTNISSATYRYSTFDGRITCTYSDNISCQIEEFQQNKWVVDTTKTFIRASEGTANALLQNISDIYPSAANGFDTRFGNFSEVSDERWFGENDQMVIKTDP